MNTEKTIDTLYRIIVQKQSALAETDVELRNKLADIGIINQEVIELSYQLQHRGGSQLSKQDFLNHCFALTSNRLLHVVQNINYGICVCDENDRIVFLNQKYLDLFNSKLTPLEFIGTPCTLASGEAKVIFTNPGEFQKEIAAIISNREPITGQKCFLNNGRTLVRDYSPIWNNNIFLGQVWMFDDITERLASEEKLEEQRRFYEDVLNQIPSDVVVLNTERQYLFVNQMAIRDENVRKWIIGKRDEDYFQLRQKPEEMLQKRISVIDEVLKTGKLTNWEERFVLPDGKIKHHLRYMYPVVDENGRVKLLIGYGMEITEQKRIADHIKRSEKRYRDLFNYSQALICTHDLTGRLLTVNPAICELLGYSEDELVGKLISEYIPSENLKDFQKHYLDPIREEGKFKGVFCVITKSKEKIFLLYKNYKVEEDGIEPYIIGFSQDITDRIESEKQLLLAKKITEDTARAKETFLANMSHEIRTPMNGVLGFANLLVKTDLDDQQRIYLKMIQESANNLLMIVNDVLDLEKILLGKLKFEHIDFSMKERIELCVQSFTYKAEEKGIALHTSICFDDDIHVIGDPYRLSQILNNMISNAVKFTNDGSVHVSVAVHEATDTLQWLEFSIADTGIGIAVEKHQEIFEPFMQANTAVTRKYGGTGLGLSISREMIHLMGGKLTLKSEPGKGSDFRFILPFGFSLAKPKHENMLHEINYQSLGKRSILVAEDVELNQFLARHIMESWGFVVDIAVNGREALEKVQQNYYDLVLMDIQMPEMDGMEATTKIRALPDSRVAGIPIVALTANALKGDSEKYMAVGMNDYLSKPFDESKLFMVISKNLRVKSIELQPGIASDTMEKITDLHKISVSDSDLNTRTDNQSYNKGDEKKLYDLKMVEAISGGDTEFVRRMVSLFLDTMPASLLEIRQATDEQRWEPLSKLAHKLKSTIDSMGIVSLKQLVRTIEANGKTGTAINELPSQVNDLLKVMEATIKQVKTDYSMD